MAPSIAAVSTSNPDRSSSALIRSSSLMSPIYVALLTADVHSAIHNIGATSSSPTLCHSSNRFVTSTPLPATTGNIAHIAKLASITGIISSSEVALVTRISYLLNRPYYIKTEQTAAPPRHNILSVPPYPVQCTQFPPQHSLIRCIMTRYLLSNHLPDQVGYTAPLPRRYLSQRSVLLRLQQYLRPMHCLTHNLTSSSIIHLHRCNQQLPGI